MYFQTGIDDPTNVTRTFKSKVYHGLDDPTKDVMQVNCCCTSISKKRGASQARFACCCRTRNLNTVRETDAEQTKFSHRCCTRIANKNLNSGCENIATEVERANVKPWCCSRNAQKQADPCCCFKVFTCECSLFTICVFCIQGTALLLNLIMFANKLFYKFKHRNFDIIDQIFWELNYTAKGASILSSAYMLYKFRARLPRWQKKKSCRQQFKWRTFDLAMIGLFMLSFNAVTFLFFVHDDHSPQPWINLVYVVYRTIMIVLLRTTLDALPIGCEQKWVLGLGLSAIIVDLGYSIIHLAISPGGPGPNSSFVAQSFFKVFAFLHNHCTMTIAKKLAQKLLWPGLPIDTPTRTPLTGSASLCTPSPSLRTSVASNPNENI